MLQHVSIYPLQYKDDESSSYFWKHLAMKTYTYRLTLPEDARCAQDFLLAMIYKEKGETFYRVSGD